MFLILVTSTFEIIIENLTENFMVARLNNKQSML